MGRNRQLNQIRNKTDRLTIKLRAEQSTLIDESDETDSKTEVMDNSKLFLFANHTFLYL